MADLDEALVLVATHFRGVRDKAGLPYVLHCLRVMMSVDSLDAKMVAVMHDLVEDTAVTMDDLRQRGFSETVLTALELVTHRDADSYQDYVVRIKDDAIACEVKLADLCDNTSPSRMLLREGREDRDTARIQKYLLSYNFLSDQIDQPTYRRRMTAIANA
ncbi:Bifunctional (p)ppGpp synthase/hydrolase RelA [Rubripirellula lacrimiformis]|uniref:Bifunctional (P)ppGpp synthase/hydrolase RelA n=1 Tax=Rubripirellula lacrimiformis TaxID=1930273 RepID=A0A517NCN4_9BACT|nr:HD domain-containing protein [Rubripirellula lacrimiformis]QDT04893.1 Bifunctional (p)ppGpp synthase/hydrolase RelA [Rubripirellula lacrimiformis]